MPKTSKKSKRDSFQKEFAKVTKGFKGIPCQTINPEWSIPGDFFVKFSLYSETSSGHTSSETSLITTL
jgi:hypothetical protein